MRPVPGMVTRGVLEATTVAGRRMTKEEKEAMIQLWRDWFDRVAGPGWEQRVVTGGIVEELKKEESDGEG